MKRKKLLVGGVAALTLAGVVGAGLWAAGALPARPHVPAVKPAAPALEFAAREVVQPLVARMPGSVEFSGPLVAPQTAVVRAKAAGTLLALNVGEGSRVGAGQVLGRIDLAELASRVAERDANVAAARATLAQAERTHATNERLREQQFISTNGLAASRAALDSARAAHDAATAALQTTQVSLRDASLVAPIAGIVARRHVVPGEKLSAEQQVLTIVDLGTLELAGSVGTHEVSLLAPGMAVSVQVEGAPQPVAGRIARIAPAVEPGTRAIGVVIALPNPRETFRAGQYAVARVLLADDADRLTVPLAAVGNTGGQDHVWVIEHGLLSRRAVTLGRRDDGAGRVEVLSGLQPAAQVLAARFDNLREGARASVGAGKAAALASAAASKPQVE